MRTFIVCMFFAMAALGASAQTQPTATKIGFADVDYIFSQMPESKQIDTELQSMQTQLKNNLETKAKEFQAKSSSVSKRECLYA
ncbi:MAG: OmpH family outer membrane protein [Bacteroidia bacterium]|nr:OmpH family outer membrane protein [Bacteroidia bacterium]